MATIGLSTILPTPSPSSSSSSSIPASHGIRFYRPARASPVRAMPPNLRTVAACSLFRRKVVRGGIKRRNMVASALRKLSETVPIAVPEEPKGMLEKFPTDAGVYGVYDGKGELQFIGITRNIAGSVASHRKAVPDLCCSVKVGPIDEPAPDRTVLTEAWKSWMQEHIEASGRVPPGNESGNNTWLRRPRKKPDIRLTPGPHVKLTVPLEDLIDRLVKENRVVAFIKGSRSSPQCGFSQRVVGILESQGVDFECVNVLDEEYNSGLRETLKTYSNWPTFPQIFVKGELLGGCDILSSMEEKGELGPLLEK